MEEESGIAKEAPKRLNGNPDASTNLAKRSKIIFQTRCNPKINFRLIHSMKGNQGFRKILSDLGLETLLHLQITRLQRELCAVLVRRVNVEKAILSVHGTDIPINYASVTKIMGLPCSGSSLELLPEVSKEERSLLCSRFNLDVTARISQYTLWEFLEANQRLDCEFKAKFLLFTIGTMIRPTTNVNIHFKEYIPLLRNIDGLSDFNWAKFLLDGLVDAVNAFQIRGAQSVGGCLLYLQLLYMHCVSPEPWRRVDECLMATPTLRNWTDDRVAVIVKILREHGGIESKRVKVRLTGLPRADATHDDYLLPQVLVHDVLIDRLKRRLDDKATTFPEVLEQIEWFLNQLAQRVQRLEDLHHSGEML